MLVQKLKMLVDLLGLGVQVSASFQISALRMHFT